ncbi:MAG TPA: glycosyl hydrolase [Gemmatimonadaceae bacterium]
MTTIRYAVLAAAGALTIAAAQATAQATSTTSLEQSFRTPPNSAQPRVWWHWMNANVTRRGIDEDLAWMHRVGVGGLQNFDASLNTPRIVQKPVTFMSDAWKAEFHHAVTLADSLGLEFTIASSPGWSETGGPWVKPEQAMKKLVWSERVVDGGTPVVGVLPAPPTVSGTFQNIASSNTSLSGASFKVPTLYHDAAVVAYRMPAAESEAQPTITASSAVDATAFRDGDLAKNVEVTFGPDSLAWVQFAYAQPTTIRALTVVAAGSGGRGGFGGGSAVGQIQVSDDGTSFRTIGELPRGGAPEETIALPPTTAKFFRVLFKQPPAPGAGLPGLGGPPQPVRAQRIAELSFTSAARIHRFEDKAAWSHIEGLDSMPTPSVSADLAVPKSSVIDLTSRMRPDGTLDWTPPAGKWRVLRLGWSLAGTLNRPASPEGTGLEVDKLDRDHVRSYLNYYLGLYAGAAGPGMVGKRGVRYMLTDSYEAAASNWTDRMIAEFTARRGYDPRPWLPALTGRVVESAEASDRFLWDFRRTLSDLISDNHYAELTRLLHAQGIGRYGESHEVRRAFIGDGMEVKKSADIPMGATWYGRANGLVLPDIRESAAVAHLYGQNLVAAESFTTVGGIAYGISPETLKPTADKMMANGLNRFVIHTSVHQPVDSSGPGVGLGPFGEWFTRHETWAEQAGAWTGYLARSSHLLQQGRNVADVAWFYGEGDNVTALYAARTPIVPLGYAWDFVNGDALRNLLTVKNGRLTAPSGASYRVLALDPAARRMTVPTLRKIRDFVRAGGIVVGEKPVETPSLSDDQAELKRLADALWNGQTGAGKVVATLDAAVAAAGLAPDVDVRGDSTRLFVHRALRDGEIYFVANTTDRPASGEMSFRVAGKAPELWRADDGTIAPLSYRIEGGRTFVTLPMTANDAVFVVFRARATAPSRRIPDRVETSVATLDGPWTVAFAPNLGAPATATFPELVSWTTSSEPGVKYFSGTGTYTKALQVSAEWRAGGSRLLLDLGSVKNIADVRVNGRFVGFAWRPPFRVDVTDAVTSGANTIEIRVSNLWPNRLIGDKQPGVDRKYAFAIFDPFRADSPLLPSGLLGPVRLLRASTVTTTSQQGSNR